MCVHLHPHVQVCVHLHPHVQACVHLHPHVQVFVHLLMYPFHPNPYPCTPTPPPPPPPPTQFLCDGLEDDITTLQRLNGHDVSTKDILIRSSSKMVVLDKLLGHLRTQRKKVLIFSQFKMMLDVLEDYLGMCGYPFERLDGSTGHQERQAAIRRFNSGMVGEVGIHLRGGGGYSLEGGCRMGEGGDAGGSGCIWAYVGVGLCGCGRMWEWLHVGVGICGSGCICIKPSRTLCCSPKYIQPVRPTCACTNHTDEVDGFVFLITTSAGGQGITLTAANTVIIYDSAYNPQQGVFCSFFF